MIPASGVLPIDKPEGPTSHDAVAAVRRALGIRQVGHTGTLDPFASGLLLVCVGSSTRLAEYLVGLPKTYRATLILGVSTDTDDKTGTPVHHSEAWRDVTPERIRAALAEQVGTVQQIPPAYSAKKVAGKRMYAVARQGGEVERTPATVTIHGIEVLRIAPPEVEFEVTCSKGTYIRAIARDVGEVLGVGAHLAALRRTDVGSWSVDGALPLDTLNDAQAVARAWISPANAVSHLPVLEVDSSHLNTLAQGGRIPAAAEIPENTPVALRSGEALLAIGERIGAEVQPRKVLA
ncbi:tRNA pseudouridine(55) synthase TruB [soil metagenome]